MSKKGDESRADAPSDSPDLASTVPFDAAETAAATENTTQLAVGEVIAGRYRIIHYLARGGMGEVYEAEDQTLGERVALKTIRGGVRSKVAAERFKREIQLARKVTHAHVCRIFDVGFHAQGEDKIVFLSMELLRGPTLFQHIHESRTLAVAEVTGLLRQVVAGLSAAHGAGVIHRDLKSANVILVQPKRGGTRAVITDFGLAYGLGGDLGHSLSGSGGIVGTPGYMAPEQIEGGDITPRSDVYALGVLMYEMLTGAMPFEGATPMAIAAKRLAQSAPSPRKLRPELPVKWDKAILACLERDPQARPESPRAVLALLGLLNDSYEDLDGTVRVSKLARRPLVRPALALLALALAVFALYRVRDRHVAGGRQALAALPFHADNARARSQPWVGAVTAELIATTLHGNETLHSFDSQPVNAALADVGVAEGDEPTAKEMERLRDLLALDLIVTGRYRVDDDGKGIALDAELRDARTDRSLTSVSERGTMDDLTAPLDRIARRIAEAAGVPRAQLEGGVGITLPRQPSGLRAYIEGKEHLERREGRGAVEAALRGLKSDPENAQLQLLLAEGYADAGDLESAATAAADARRLAAGLPHRERLFVEAASSVAVQDRATAISRYEQLRGELPNDPDLLWRLVEQLTASGRTGEALRLIDQLHGMPLSRLLALRVDELEVLARIGTADLDRALVVARGAVEAADSLGARQWRARGRYVECRVLRAMGRQHEARSACDETRRIAAEAGERRLRGEAVNLIAGIDLATGDLIGARRGYEQTREVFHELGDLSGERMVLNNLGVAQLLALDREGARDSWEKALDIAEKLHDAVDAVPTQQNLSEDAIERLDWKSALGYAEDALRTARATEEPADLVDMACRVASLYLEVGRGSDVERLLAELDVRTARAVMPPAAEVDCALTRSDVELGRGHFAAAVQALRQAAQHTSENAPERLRVGVALARALAESGDRPAALAELDLLGDKASFPNDEAPLRAAHLLRLRLAVAPGNAERVQLHELELSVKRESGQRIALAQEIDVERARALIESPAMASRRLSAIAARAMRANAVSCALEAQLHAAEIRANTGARPTTGAAQDYARRARAAGRPGWADRMLQFAEAKR